MTPTTTTPQVSVLREALILADDAMTSAWSYVKDCDDIAEKFNLAGIAVTDALLMQTERAAIQTASQAELILDCDAVTAAVNAWRESTNNPPSGNLDRWDIGLAIKAYLRATTPPASPVQAKAEQDDNGMCRSCVNDLCVTGPECVTLGRDSAPEANSEASELPPLPENDGRFNINGADGHRVKGWDEDSVRAYGQLCRDTARQPVAAPSDRDAALEEAAQLVWSDLPDAGVLRGAANCIRALKRKSAAPVAQGEALTDAKIFEIAEGFQFSYKGNPHKMSFSQAGFIKAVRAILAKRAGSAAA